MRSTIGILAIGGLLAHSSYAAPSVKNFIYIVPDGYGPASQTMARDYASLLENGQTPGAPVSYQLPADQMVIGNVRTLASNNLITDSAASATAFGCGVKTYNNAIAVDDDGQPVGSILEAAKLNGLRTGLVVTSTINHATPACYVAHVADRNSYAKIAEHEIGYGHPLGPAVDILMGGGRCYFKPQSDETSCRSDDIDLISFAKDHGYYVMQNRSAFDNLEGGKGDIPLPFLGLFNDDQMKYEIDRSRQPEDGEEEPSLLEMVQTSLNALHRATSCKKKGFFLMIEASRIDHAGHASDPAAHLFDTLMYNEVMGFVREWIDAHPDTMMMSAADHECGGLTLRGYNPLPLGGATASTEVLARRFSEFSGTDAEKRAFLKSEILPAYGLEDATDTEINTLLAASSLSTEMGNLLASRAGVNWSTGGHTATDITLYGYGAGDNGRAIKADMAGNWDNTQLPGYIEAALGVKISDVTTILRANGTGWVGKRDFTKRADDHIHSHEHAH
ncbi:putative alkaline phosphatase protein [Phaeoacremonium minimum UCRPA7]|uniref:Alkaline phosphatase n=1 Tax=Phaeoacremonium minimum (strain UCR-PA7) TaxID=1286976 RepID=R8B8V3_PHAM7|nr:putative alkaline phosphatase protein [Phaeoacremonium minimum UCRPA7]EON95707.1 putative alkaline phosphatase protein [Phaeoacremonium minimum UCRPA7]